MTNEEIVHNLLDLETHADDMAYNGNVRLLEVVQVQNRILSEILKHLQDKK